MNVLLIFVIVVHVIVSFFLIGVVLLQQGRSADLAGAFGGQGSQTAFGPRAAANVLTRLTTWSAIIFMCTSITLTILYQRSSTGTQSVLENSKTAPIYPCQVRQIANKPFISIHISNNGKPFGLLLFFVRLLHENHFLGDFS